MTAFHADQTQGVAFKSRPLRETYAWILTIDRRYGTYIELYIPVEREKIMMRRETRERKEEKGSGDVKMGKNNSRASRK